MKQFGDKYKGALFADELKEYRYCLWRIWNDEKPKVMFVGLNPSTADERREDNTIRAVMQLSYAWGFGGFYMTNLFAYVSKNPKDLLEDMTRKVGVENNRILKQYAKKAKMIVFAWGAFDVNGRDKEVIAMFPSNSYALMINKDGTPRHPLYVSRKVKPVNFNDCKILQAIQ